MPLVGQHPPAGECHRARLRHRPRRRNPARGPAAGTDGHPGRQAAVQHRPGAAPARSAARPDERDRAAVHPQGAEEEPRQHRPLRPHLRPVAAEHLRQDRRVQDQQGRLQGGLNRRGSPLSPRGRGVGGEGPSRRTLPLTPTAFSRGERDFPDSFLDRNRTQPVLPAGPFCCAGTPLSTAGQEFAGAVPRKKPLWFKNDIGDSFCTTCAAGGTAVAFQHLSHPRRVARMSGRCTGGDRP